MTPTEELNNVIKYSQANLKRLEALNRLRNNKDFKDIVMEGYFKEEAIRLVHLKSDPASQTNDKQTAILRDIDAIGTLASYFNTIVIIGDRAQKSIEESNQTLYDIAKEEDE